MERVIFQIKHNDKTYNKFLLLVKNKKIEKDDKTGNEQEVVEYKARELLANKQVHIEYYNKIFVEGDFDNTLSKVEFKKVIDFLKKQKIITYINTDFKEIDKIL